MSDLGGTKNTPSHLFPDGSLQSASAGAGDRSGVGQEGGQGGGGGNTGGQDVSLPECRVPELQLPKQACATASSRPGKFGRTASADEPATGLSRISSAASRESSRDDDDEPMQFKMAPTGRHLLAQMPRTISARLNRLDERNKALKKALQMRTAEKEAGDSRHANSTFGPAAVGAADFLNECKWDMQVAVNAMLDAIHRSLSKLNCC